MANNWTVSVFLLIGSFIATNPLLAQSVAPSPAVQPEVVQVPTAAPPAAVAQGGIAPAQPVPGVVPMQPSMPLLPGQSVVGGPITAAVIVPLAIEPGSGLLVQLPRPASTVIAADPRVVRVTPASPTSLFMVGIAAGRTNVIVTNEAGIPIIQYDVSVRRSGGDMVAAAPGVPSAPTVPAPRGANASQLEATLRQHVPGASGV